MEERFDVIICRGWRASQLDLERHLRRLLRYLDVDCVFDVGANSGQFADMLRSTVGYAGLIISFEPNPEQFSVLRARASRDPLWQALPQALGREAGEAVFNVYASSELSSLRSLDPGAGHQPADPVRLGQRLRSCDSGCAEETQGNPDNISSQFLMHSGSLPHPPLTCDITLRRRYPRFSDVWKSDRSPKQRSRRFRQGMCWETSPSGKSCVVACVRR